MILEDDFTFLVNSTKFLNLLENFYKNIHNYTFLLLGTNLAKFTNTNNENIFNVNNSQTTSGYIINEKVYDKFIKVIEESISNMVRTKSCSNYAIDQAWKKLQDKSVYSFNKNNRVGIQRESYSDIEQKNVNYRC